MSELVTLSDQLTDEEWLAEIAELGEDRGYYEPVGPSHGALFIDESPETLIVSFDTIVSARRGSASGIPHGMLHAELNGWSHLSLLARTDSWFRDPWVYRYFDRLGDDGFFDAYDRVVFYGTGSCGYAAAAFSVASPGSTVIAVAPQATLDPGIAIWDDRFTGQRRRDFNIRYGYAPDMLEAAAAAYVFYDPYEELDAMHAALFRAPHVTRVPVRFGGPRLGTDLEAMGAIGPVLKAAGLGTLDAHAVHTALRRRRDYLPYLRNLLNRVHVEERHFLTALLCRAVLAHKTNAPRFRHHLELSEHRLSMQGRALPEPRRRKSAASRFPDLN